MTDDNEMIYTNPQGITLDNGLYLVPTPIGNLRDITMRAMDVLRLCDAVVCEDTRMTGKLLAAYDIRDKKKIVYNDHSTERDRQGIIDRLRRGEKLALVSDAGTPLISDPGYKLVRDCYDNNITVTALPGASALLPALQLSGLPSDSFLFAGFPPSKEKALQEFLMLYKNRPETLLFYESPKRLDKTLDAMQKIFGPREAAVIREITKLYEESIRGTLPELATRLADKPVKGEVVLVVAGHDGTNATEAQDAAALLADMMARGLSVKDAVAAVVDMTGGHKKDVYKQALALKEGHGG